MDCRIDADEEVSGVLVLVGLGKANGCVAEFISTQSFEGAKFGRGGGQQEEVSVVAEMIDGVGCGRTWWFLTYYPDVSEQSR